MSKSTILRFVLLLAVTSTSVLAQSTPKTDSTRTVKASTQPLKLDLVPPLQQMIANIKKLKTTGDPDIDYIGQAKLHAQGTQDLLKAIIEAQPDSALRMAAKTMLSTTETDLTALDKLQKDLKPAGANAAFAKQQKRVIAAISEKIKQSASTYKLTKNPEANIHILLGDQRQDAINLATGYLQFGKNVELRNFAQQTVEKAKLDIDVLKNLPNRSK